MGCGTLLAVIRRYLRYLGVWEAFYRALESVISRYLAFKGGCEALLGVISRYLRYLGVWTDLHGERYFALFRVQRGL